MAEFVNLEGTLEGESLEIYFKIPTAGPDNSKQGVVKYLLDTGFQGSISLPGWLARDLDLKPYATGHAQYAGPDGRVMKQKIAEVFVSFGEKIYSARAVVLPDDAHALIGRRLIQRCHLEVEMVPGGKAVLQIPVAPEESADEK